MFITLQEMMLLLKQFERLERIDRLIKLKATGSPKEFAEKLEISESTLFELLKVMKLRGAAIVYSQFSCSYIYLEPFEIKFGSIY